jgi:hypothetical protein
MMRGSESVCDIMLSAIDRSALVIPQRAPGKPLEQCRKWARWGLGSF